MFVREREWKTLEKPVVNTVTIRLDVRETTVEVSGTKVEDSKRRSEKNGRKKEREGEGEERVAVDVPMCSCTKSINLVCSSEHVGQQCPLREQPRRTSLRPLFRPRFHVVPGEGGERRGGEGRGGVYPSLPPSRALPTTSRSQKTTHASTVHGEGFSSAPATVERPLECHSSKFATRQVASSRMALPASSSGDEVEGNPFSRGTGREGGVWVTKFFGYPPAPPIRLAHPLLPSQPVFDFHA